jgi:hypothetical protein
MNAAVPLPRGTTIFDNSRPEREVHMPKCECLPGCAFYNDKMPIESGLGAIFKKKYCETDNLNCARFMVFKKYGKGTVPANLFPNMIERAGKIISGAETHA